MSDDRQSFWTTLPGILTGLAALITALVGLAALFLGRGENGSPPSARNVVTDQGSAATAAGGMPEGPLAEGTP